MNAEPLNAVTNNGSKADELIRQREFGVYLRDARVAAGLSTYDVADRLKLHEDIIKSLESSRVDTLPAAAFTQGYIKAYAKLLKIAPDEIMRAYDAMVPEKIAKLNITSGVPAERSSHDGLIKAGGYVLALGLVLLFGFWVQQSGFTLPGNFVQISGDMMEPADVPSNIDTFSNGVEAVDDVVNTEFSMSPSVPIEPLASPLSAQNMPLTNNVSVSENKPNLPVALNNKPSAASVTKIEQQAKIALNKPMPTSSQPDVKRVDIKSVELKPVDPRPVEPKPVMLVNGTDAINLSSSAESWAEIQDADNNRLFYSMLKAGDVHVIKGRAPFKVFLGNAPVVSLKVNNQVVDIARYVRQNNVAHIKINAGANTSAGGPRDSLQQVIDQFIPETTVVE